MFGRGSGSKQVGTLLEQSLRRSVGGTIPVKLIAKKTFELTSQLKALSAVSHGHKCHHVIFYALWATNALTFFS